MIRIITIQRRDNWFEMKWTKPSYEETLECKMVLDTVGNSRLRPQSEL